MGFKDDSKICGLKTMWNNYLLECRKTVERTDLGGGGVHRFDLGLVNFKMPTGYSNGDVQ